MPDGAPAEAAAGAVPLVCAFSSTLFSSELCNASARGVKIARPTPVAPKTHIWFVMLSSSSLILCTPSAWFSNASIKWLRQSQIDSLCEDRRRKGGGGSKLSSPAHALAKPVFRELVRVRFNVGCVHFQADVRMKERHCGGEQGR